MSGSFNFQSFLVKMREKSAFGLVTEIKEFIAEHSKQKLLPDEFVEIILQFLAETNQKVAQHDLWKECSHEELDNAAEGLEKYLMNKMYKACFQPSSSDDALRDQALAERLSLLSFVRPEHLDIPPALCEDKAIAMAMKELCKMDTYKAPRDKMVCVLNCCKIINNILQSHKEEAGADEFFPMLVYITLMAKPPNLHSNIKFIERFRNQDKLSGEAGYYFTNLHGAMTFAQKMSADKLTITQQQFDDELNKALQQRDEQQQKEEELAMLDQATATVPLNTEQQQPHRQLHHQQQQQHHNSNNLIDLAVGNSMESWGPTMTPSEQPLQPSLIDLPGMLGDDLQTIETPQTMDAMTFITQGRDLASSAPPIPTNKSQPRNIMSMSNPQPVYAIADSVTDETSNAQATSATQPNLGRLQVSSSNSLEEMMAALSEPPVDKFLTCSVEQLTMTDIPLLLSDYKRMVNLTSAMKQFLADQGITDTLNV